MCEFDAHGTRLPGAAGFVDELVTAMVNSRIYSSDHPRVRDSLDDLEQRLQGWFADGAIDFSLTVADGYLIFDQRPLRGVSMSAARIMQALESIGSGGLQFTVGAGRGDIAALLQLLGERDNHVSDFEEANRAVQSFGGLNVRFLPEYGIAAEQQLGGEGEDASAHKRANSRDLSLPIELYQGVVDTMQSITIDVCRGDQFSLDSARTQLEHVMHRLDDDPKAIMALSRYEHYDAFTFGHSIRVAFLAMAFARQITQDEQIVQRIGLAGLMHDVGKARVPFEILQCRTRLSDAQRQEMEGHTVFGGEILLDLADSDPWAVSSAFGHHRNADGGGYPKTLAAARLSTVTKLVKICDVYEALTAERPYKAGMSPVRAYRIMMSMGHFDAAMLRLFIKTIGVYPIGTQVELCDGRIAWIEAQTEDLRYPVIRIDATPDGDRVDEQDQTLIDMSAVRGSGVEVARWLKPADTRFAASA